MSRSPVCSLTLAGVLLAAVPGLAAQAPKPELLAAFTGTWHMDRERSEPMPENLRALLMPTQVVPRDSTSTEVISGTGAPPRGRRGGGGGGGGAPGASLAPRGRGMGGGPGMRYLREMATELAPPPDLVLRVTADSATLANLEGASISWPVDGRVHQHAQLDGTMLEEMGRWKGERLELHNAVTGMIDLKRELRLVNGGTVLELKIELAGAGLPSKATRKVVYVRSEK